MTPEQRAQAKARSMVTAADASVLRVIWVQKSIGWDEATLVTRIDLSDKSRLYAGGASHPFAIALAGDLLQTGWQRGAAPAGALVPASIVGAFREVGWAGNPLVRLDIFTGQGGAPIGRGDCHWYLPATHPYAGAVPVTASAAGDAMWLSLVHYPVLHPQKKGQWKALSNS